MRQKISTVKKSEAFCVRHVYNASDDSWQLMAADGQPLPDVGRFLHRVGLRGLSSRSLRTYAYDLLCAYRWMYQRRLDPQELSGEQLVEFIDFMRQPPPAAPSTINRRVRLLERFVAFLTGKPPPLAPWQVFQPLRPYRRSRRSSLYVRVPSPLIEPLSDSEVLAFLRSLHTWRDRAIAVLMWGAGLRACEILGLQLQDVDLHRMGLRIHGKRQKERMMPLAQAVAKPLLHYLNFERPSTACCTFFVALKGPRRGQPMTYAGLRRLFRYHRLKSKVSKANPHRFRHTFGVNMTRCRVPLAVLSRMMGHAFPHTTMRYVQLHDEEVHEEYDRALRALSHNGVLDG